mmetsp:Transcript_55974/g.65397  ORF Transcript_55974/g.65397 Transcript_55974/m.65397 type:complete len:109 (+) Transcript_55974:431-757(+)
MYINMGNTNTCQLFRDCLRLIQHIAPGHSPKGTALKTMLRSEFVKSSTLKSSDEIENAKNNAVRALSNYMLYESGSKDNKLKKSMDRFNNETLSSSPNKENTPPTSKE